MHVQQFFHDKVWSYSWNILNLENWHPSSDHSEHHKSFKNIILIFYITEHANLPIHSTDKFTHLAHFANSAVCFRFLHFSPSNFAFMIRVVFARSVLLEEYP